MINNKTAKNCIVNPHSTVQVLRFANCATGHGTTVHPIPKTKEFRSTKMEYNSGDTGALSKINGYIKHF